ncbi:MAG: oligosaccharide flippase family protein [Alphaproteobacteria bacterium]|nr:oligosaccharide flippase family protein [Alphaproteobacteria bacterium]
MIELSMGAIAVIFAALAAPLIGPGLGWSPAAVHFSLFYSIAIFATVRTTPQGILQIAERFDLIGLHQVLMPISRLTGALLVWAFDGGLFAFLWVWLLSALVEGLSMWIMGLWVLRRMRLDGRLAGSVRGIVPANPGLIGFIMTTNADITLRELAPRAAPLVLGWVLGPAAAGLYSLAQRASVVLQQPAQMLGQASYAVIAKLVAAGNFPEMRQAVSKSLLIAMAVSVPITLLLALFGKPLLGLLGGKGFKEGVSLLVLIAISRTITVGTPSLSAALTALGKPGSSIMVNLAANLGLLPLLPLFLHLMGLSGAGWHMILQSLTVFLLLIWYFRRELRAAECKGSIRAGVER